MPVKNASGGAARPLASWDGNRWSAYPNGERPGGGGSLPSWVSGMASTNTVYAVGETPSTVLPGRISWPASGANNRLESGGSDNNALYLTSGYGGAVYVPELGNWGTMIFASTGEHSLTEQMTSFGISEATPSWNFYQQPLYATSSAEADTFNADWYYSPTDYAALASAQKLAYTADGPATATWLATWASNGKTFPVGYDDWVMRRKYGAGAGSTALGNGRPHWFRYSMPCYVPPELASRPTGALLCTNMGTIYGPFNQDITPSGASDADWFDSSELVSGARKRWLYSMDVSTKAWTRLPTPFPSSITPGGIMHPQSAVDLANKRVYYTCQSGSSPALCYADLSAGLTGQTMVGPTVLTDNASGPGFGYNSVLAVPTSGSLAGKRLWFFQEYVTGSPTTALLLIDLDGNTLNRLSITGLPSGLYRFGYDAANNKVYITIVGGSISCYRFSIPTGYLTAGNYTLETLTISMNGNSVEGSANLSEYGHRSMYLAGLGVILVPMKTAQVLAFKPG